MKIQSFALAATMWALTAAAGDVPSYAQSYPQPYGQGQRPPQQQQYQQYQQQQQPQQGQVQQMYEPTRNPGTVQIAPNQVQENAAYQTYNSYNCYLDRNGRTVITPQVVSDQINRRDH